MNETRLRLSTCGTIAKVFSADFEPRINEGCPFPSNSYLRQERATNCGNHLVGAEPLAA